MSGPVATAIERAYRDEWSRIVSTLIRVTGDWDLAEDCASEALARAWQRWPAEGAPDNPGAWLTTVARRRALDVLRRRARESDKYTELALTPSWDDAQAVGSAGEAIRLARLLVRLLPEEPEPRGLLALMLLQHARRDARSVDGDVVTLDRQDRSRWHTAEIAEGLTLLETTMGGGPYVVQAHIQAEHARAARAEDTRWDRIVWLYERLQDHTDSPVVALNHAIAVGFDQGPAAALAALQALVYDRRLQDNFLLPAAQAEFLAQAGDVAGAEAAYAEAIALAPPGPQQRLLERKRSELARRV